MLERLATLLAGLATPAQLQSVLEAVTVLGENGFYQFEQIVDDEIAICQEEPTKLIGNLIDQHLIPMLRTYLGTLGIVPAVDLSLPDLTEIFDATMRLENFEDQQILFGLASSDEDNEDILAGMLAVVTAKTDEHFLPKIESVSDAFITRVSELTSGFDDTEHVDPEVYANSKRRVVELLRVVNNGPLFEVYHDNINLDQIKLGYDVEMTIAGIRDQLEDRLDDVVALTIIFHTLASNTPSTDVKSKVGREIELAVTDMMRAMKVSKLASDMLSKVGYD